MPIPPRRLTLASASPRRLELLRAGGWEVESAPADIDESMRPGEEAAEYVRRLAQEKAARIAMARPPETVVLGADTAVVVEGEVLGKPGDEAEAAAMLARLAGREHAVLTGVCLRRGAVERIQVETTRVWFSPLTPAEIAAYAASGEPRGKAGGYAIQGRAACFIPRIEGSYSNVVGLPLAVVWKMWKTLRLD